MNRQTSLVIHGLIGWAICGATIGIGRQLLPMNVTLIVHALVAPVAFGLLTWNHTRRFPESSARIIALSMVGMVIGLDAGLVAPVFERSYKMFRSVLGTWIPFTLILGASYLAAKQTISNRTGRKDAAEHAHAPVRRA